jgi:hypothetical protein
MGNINLSDILNLRLTCKTTKAWADKSKFLCKLRIHIHSTSTINKLLSHQTETPWNNFDFKCNLSRWKDQQPIQGFTCNFGNQIQVLEFSVVRSRDTPGILQILIGCTSLKRLIINKLNCTYLESLCPQKKVGLSKSLRNLDQLGVYKLMCHHPSDADSFMRYVLLQCVSSLKSVAIPVIKFPRTAVLLFHKKDELVNNHSPTCTSFYVMSPMIQLFESQARGLQTIVVLPETRRLLSDSALFCLSLLCYNRKIHLVYGTMAGSQLLTLGRLNYHLSAHPTMSEIASKILTVMGATTDLLLNHEFKNLRTLLVQFKSFNINQDLFVVQDFPKLNVVCMDFQRHEGNEVQLRRMNMFVQGILDVKRPSVKQFMVQHHDEVESWVQLCPTKISIAFANLNEIALISWNGLDDSFLVLWRNLKLLKKVDVKNCPHLTDRGILGADLVNPAMKNLKCKLYNISTFTHIHRPNRKTRRFSLTAHSLFLSYRFKGPHDLQRWKDYGFELFDGV